MQSVVSREQESGGGQGSEKGAVQVVVMDEILGGNSEEEDMSVYSSHKIKSFNDGSDISVLNPFLLTTASDDKKFPNLLSIFNELR
jgi:hypothetical protein